jgi:hypothetical protein
VANRNKPNSPRVVKDVQSNNQLVDSGQYYLQDAMKDMDNIVDTVSGLINDDPIQRQQPSLQEKKH